MTAYQDFLASKTFVDHPSGFDLTGHALTNGGDRKLFPFQEAIVHWALKRGRAAIFADTGLGKTAMQASWAWSVFQHTGNRVLILAPLCVAPQTVTEAGHFGIPIRYVREMPESGDTGIFITNYEMLEHFETWIEKGYFDGIVLDESSILKSQNSKTRARLIALCKNVPYRLSCTATPSPNDYMELGNQSEFLGVMGSAEMMACFFTHNTSQLAEPGEAKWRLKGHAKERFWEWMSHWATFVKRPSDLGFDDAGYDLPELRINEVVVKTGESVKIAQSLQERNDARTTTIQPRCNAVRELVYGHSIGGSQELHEGLVIEESGQSVGIQKGHICPEECETKSLLCVEPEVSGEVPEAVFGVAESEPGEAKGPEAETVRAQLSGVHGPLRVTERQMCDLRDKGKRGPEVLSDGGPLPQDGGCSRTALYELQSGTRQVSGRHNEPISCSELSTRREAIPSTLIWCHRNAEQELLESIFGKDCVSIHGGTSLSDKETFERQWRNGEVPILITKPKVFGFGMNWQHCSRMIFVGLNDSYEQLYQAIRRCYRFGQTKPVDVTLITADSEGAVRDNIRRKERQAEEMSAAMMAHMRDFCRREVSATFQQRGTYERDVAAGDDFTIHLGDCVEVARELADESVDFSIFSPPFASLFTYSNLDRDMGNSKNHAEFWRHFEFLVHELYRVLRAGRNISIHCAQLPKTKGYDGQIGLRDFRGDIIRLFEKAGFIYHSEVVVWKDPVVAMQRTKAIGLLWKQIKKDSSMSRQGIPDYVVTFRKPGENTRPLAHTPAEFPVNLWQELASPCWMDIKQSNTLNRKLAREESDERHICPLQLDLIERCLFLWSIPGDVVFSPFTGIGSEGYVATAMGRRFVGSELKRSYFEIAKANLIGAPRAGYRFPHFQKSIGDWNSSEPARPALTIVESNESCESQIDWISDLQTEASGMC